MPEGRNNNPGLYVHVPFCRCKCRYCDFASRPPREGDMERFTQALSAELALRPQSRPMASIYFGGGTPSFLAPHGWLSRWKRSEAVSR